MSVAVNYDPSPATPLGLTARVAPSWGGEAGAGAEALWATDSIGTSGGHRLGGTTRGQRLDTDVGYGFPVGRQFIGTPRIGLRTSRQGREYRLGYSLQVVEQGSLRMQLGIEAERRVSPIFGLLGNASKADQRVLGQASVEW